MGIRSGLQLSGEPKQTNLRMGSVEQITRAFGQTGEPSAALRQAEPMSFQMGSASPSSVLRCSADWYKPCRQKVLVSFCVAFAFVSTGSLSLAATAIMFQGVVLVAAFCLEWFRIEIASDEVRNARAELFLPLAGT